MSNGGIALKCDNRVKCLASFSLSLIYILVLVVVAAVVAVAAVKDVNLE